MVNLNMESFFVISLQKMLVIVFYHYLCVTKFTQMVKYAFNAVSLDVDSLPRMSVGKF